MCCAVWVEWCKTMALRQVTSADAEQMAAISLRGFLPSFGGLYSRADLRLCIEEKLSVSAHHHMLEDSAQEIWLAENDAGEVEGFVHIAPNGLPVGEATDGELCRLYLMPEAQGKKLGDDLLRWGIERLQQRGYRRIYLGVWEHNHRAQRFYARHGFRVVGDYFYTVGGHKDHELIMYQEMAAG